MKKNTDSKNHQEIRQEVDDFYNRVAASSKGVEVEPDSIYQSLGFDESLLMELPEDIRSGLSCGNPVEHLYVEEGDVILDLGCGMGLDVFMAKLKYPQAGMIYGVDKLPAMIQRAERARVYKKFEGIEFKQGVLTDLPFLDQSIDRVISNCVINLEHDKQKVYEEIYRVLKPNGMFFISDITLKKELSEEMRQQKDLYGS